MQNVAPMTGRPDPLQHERLLSVDVVKCVAVICLVVLHSCDLFLDGSDKDPANWWVGFTYAALSICCVPLFIMASGTLLLQPGKTFSLTAYYAKRLPKLLVPLFVWSVVYYLSVRIPANLTLADFGNFFSEFFNGRVARHLWFIYMMFGLYLSVPFLCKMFQDVPRQYYYGFIGLCFLFGPPSFVLSNFFNVALFLSTSLFSIFMGNFVLGYFVYAHKEKMPRFRQAACIVFAAAVLFTVLGCYGMRGYEKSVRLMFLDYSTLNVHLASVSVFILLVGGSYARLRPYASQIALLSNASYGIYLVHMLVREMLRTGFLGFTFTPYSLPPILGIPASAGVMLLISFAMVMVLKKIPVLRHVVP